SSALISNLTRRLIPARIQPAPSLLSVYRSLRSERLSFSSRICKLLYRNGVDTQQTENSCELGVVDRTLSGFSLLRRLTQGIESLWDCKPRGSYKNPEPVRNGAGRPIGNRRNSRLKI